MEKKNQVFDKSNANRSQRNVSSVQANQVELELQDVDDEITDEVESSGTGRLLKKSTLDTLELERNLTFSQHANKSPNKHHVSKPNKSTSVGLMSGPRFQKSIQEKVSNNENSKQLRRAKTMDESSPGKCHCNQKKLVQFETNTRKTSLPLENQIRTKKPTIDRRKSAPFLRIQKTKGKTEETDLPNLQRLHSSSNPASVHNTSSSNAASVQKTFSESKVDKQVAIQMPQQVEKELSKTSSNNDSSEEEIEEEIVDIIDGIDDQHISPTGAAISADVIKALNRLTLGSEYASFGTYWQRESLRFKTPGHYGLEYHRSGSEGMMASIQAFMLKHFLFGEQCESSKKGRISAESRCNKCLAMALTDIIWRASSGNNAVIVLTGLQTNWIVNKNRKGDDILEKVKSFQFSEREELLWFINKHLTQFQDPNGRGCILFLYSLILSRSIERIKEDLGDYFPSHLLGSLQECSQPLINLLLTGRAVPYIFNGVTQVQSLADGKETLLSGIDKRSEIGFLSYEEVLDPKQYLVGSMLKTPLYPIWVINNHGHYCVVYCCKRDLLNDWKLERRFDLYYYGGVPRHINLPVEETRLTIDTIIPFVEDEFDAEDHSTLEDTIRIKWPESVIDWNGFHRF